jgi:hypothetical protein
VKALTRNIDINETILKEFENIPDKVFNAVMAEDERTKSQLLIMGFRTER